MCMQNLFRPLLLLLALAPVFSCTTPDQSQALVNASIEAHGGKLFEESSIAFDFRDKHYTYTRQGDAFTYTRSFTDSTGAVQDVLDNEGFARFVDGVAVDLPEERSLAYSNSVNSVIYFGMLPYRLNDPAVNKAYVGETEIEGSPYHIVKVTFEKEGGGVDYEDEFLYWINANTHTLDYLAYSYDTDGGGLRFRKAVNPRTISGIRFQDYINYKPENKEIPLDSLELLYKAGALEEVSEIRLQNIVVAPADATEMVSQ